MALDLFQTLSDVPASALHPKFILIRDGIQFEVARKVLTEWTEGFVDRDNKIIKEFQTTFHSSFWEFYLFKVFTDAGFTIDFSHDRPDFIVTAPIAINIEATISNIKIGGESEINRSIENILSMITPVWHQQDFKTLMDEAIVRNSNAILGKDKKFQDGYSKCDWVKPETPFVIALSSYDQIDYGREYYYPMMALLYGQYYDPSIDNYNAVSEILKPGTSSPILVGLFNDAKFQHISGILFSCTTTLGKLNSAANSIIDSDQQLNEVLNIKHDTETPHYKLQLVSKISPEEISEGLFFFHNPFAINKIPFEVFRKTDCLQITVTPSGPYIEGENLPIVSRINLPKGMLNKAVIEAIYHDYNS